MYLLLIIGYRRLLCILSYNQFNFVGYKTSPDLTAQTNQIIIVANLLHSMFRAFLVIYYLRNI